MYQAYYKLGNRVVLAVLRKQILRNSANCSFRRFASNRVVVESSRLPRGSILAALGTAVVFIGLQRRSVAAEHQAVDELPDTALAPEQCTEAQLPNRQNLTWREAVQATDELLQRIKTEFNCPGLVVTVTVDGKEVFSKGYGLADVENVVPCKPDTVMRIASISKPLTMVAVARLMEQGKLDLDKPIQSYVPSWPEKKFDGKKVTITTRQLVTMMAGIRHYDKSCGKDKKAKDNASKDETKKPTSGEQNKSQQQQSDEFDLKEYYIKKHYPDVTSSLKIFQDDELCSSPGSELLYSTYAWTLVSAVVEGASGPDAKFTNIMKTVFHDLGMDNTYLDENGPIIGYRARNYIIDKKTHRIVNAPYVDNSYKWAGGGFLSTTSDLCRFGNAMLYSYQWTKQSGGNAGYLQPDTVRTLWTPVARLPGGWDRKGSYGMGWMTVPGPEVSDPGCCRNQRRYVSHTGGAVGASSVLLILPRDERAAEPQQQQQQEASHSVTTSGPRGVVVAIIVNMQSIGLNRTALKIASLFDRLHTDN